MPIIDPTLYLAFIATVAMLMLVPGPNVALITSASIAHGTRAGFLTVLGTSCAMIPQLALTALGMTALLGLMAQLFDILRWLGVAYLFYLGLRCWLAAPDRLNVETMQSMPINVAMAKRLLLRGFLVSFGNPKTLLFYGAFLPQFIAADRAAGPQLALLSVTFLALALGVDSGWALLAGRSRHLLLRHGRLRQRMTGGLLMTAAIGLAVAHRR
ncbi:LysE family translocator [Dongia soli]|uniref:LysE family translocator n=1 Tax=Dongia soli TaxID=600628 RepID=A0ABU5E986_9PROT|nr:LysE family translocator [Dongia soli]MDY0882411.1 LysE family translocator [Dongia soli]